MPATAQIRIGADTKQFQKAMQEVQKGMGVLQRQVVKTSGIINKSLSFLSKVGKFGIIVGAPAGLVTATRAFTKFEKDIMEVFTLLPNANKAFLEEMKRDALKFSQEYGIQPEEVTKGMYQAISAGIDPIGLTSGFLKVAQEAAIAGVTDLRTSVDALTNVVNSYGENVYDMQYVSDLMFKSVSMSKLTFRELSDYMYQILPTAGSLKLRLDDLLGSISALAATGTLTRVGTTQLRQFLIELSRSGDKANLAFLEASGGVPFEKFIKNGGRMTQVIEMLGQVAKRRQVSLRNLFGSVEAGNAALTLFNSQGFEGMVGSLEDPAGSTEVAALKMMDTIAFRMERLKRVVMNTFIKIGDVIRPVMEDVIRFLEVRMTELAMFDWDLLKRNFKQKWEFIKALVNEGLAFDYIVAQARVAFADILSFIVSWTERITSTLAALFSSESGLKLKETLLSLADAFLDKMIQGFAKLTPAILSALNPVLAFVEASFAKAKASIMPESEEDREKLVQKKIQVFDEEVGLDKVDGNDITKAYETVKKAYNQHLDDNPMDFGFSNFMGEDVPFAAAGAKYFVPVGDDRDPPSYREALEQLSDAVDAVRVDQDTADKFDLTPDGMLGSILAFTKGGFSDLSEDKDRLLDLDNVISPEFAKVKKALQFFAAKKVPVNAVNNRRKEQTRDALNKMRAMEDAVKLLMQNAREIEGKSAEIKTGDMVFNDIYKEALKDNEATLRMAQDAADDLRGPYEKQVNNNLKNALVEVKTAAIELGQEIQRIKFKPSIMLDDIVKGKDHTLEEIEIIKQAMQDPTDFTLDELGAMGFDSDTLDRLNGDMLVGLKKLKDQKSAFEAVAKQIEGQLMPELEKPEEATIGDELFEKRDKPREEGNIRGFIPGVVADSKQKVGGGGRAFTLDPNNLLIDSFKNLRTSVDRLNETFSGMSFDKVKYEEGMKLAEDASVASQFKSFNPQKIETIDELKSALKNLNIETDGIDGVGSLSEEANRLNGFITKWNQEQPDFMINDDVLRQLGKEHSPQIPMPSDMGIGPVLNIERSNFEAPAPLIQPVNRVENFNLDGANAKLVDSALHQKEAAMALKDSANLLMKSGARLVNEEDVYPINY